MRLKAGASRDKRGPRPRKSADRKRRQGEPADWTTATYRASSTTSERSEIYSLVTTTDLALLATLIHDAIGHLMNAIDKAAKVQEPIERIADAIEDTAATMKIAVQWDDMGMAFSGAKSRKR